MKPKAKFYIGDYVKCVGEDKPSNGAGWKEGLIFKIDDVIAYGSNCYFGGENGHGVFEENLEFVQEPFIPKRGEKVIVIGDSCFHFYPIGKTLTVHSVGSDGNVRLIEGEVSLKIQDIIRKPSMFSRLKKFFS